MYGYKIHDQDGIITFVIIVDIHLVFAHTPLPKTHATIYNPWDIHESF